MDRRGSADRAAVDGGRGPLNGRLAGHYGSIIPRFASVSGRPPRLTSGPPPAHGARPAASAEPATAPPKATQIATGGRHRCRRPDATQRCFNPEFSERIRNLRRTGCGWALPSRRLHARIHLLGSGLLPCSITAAAPSATRDCPCAGAPARRALTAIAAEPFVPIERRIRPNWSRIHSTRFLGY